MEINSKYKYNDKVWIAVDPRNLVDESEVPVFEVTIKQVEVTTLLKGDDSEITTRYKVDMGTFDEPFWRDESFVYGSEAEAIIQSIASVQKLYDTHSRKAEHWKTTLDYMKQEKKS